MKKFLVSLCLVVASGAQIVRAEDPVALTKKMISETGSIKTLKCTFETNERIGRIYVKERSLMKISSSPLKIYLYQYQPVKGLECLYVNGENSGRVKVNPNSFPWVTLNLDPNGNTMLDKRHHPVYQAGFGYTVSLINILLNKYQSNISSRVLYSGSAAVAGVQCHHISFKNPDYSMQKYTAGKGETLLSIARNKNINHYSILELNNISSPSKVIENGTVLTIPSDYAFSMDLYIHKEKFYPVKISIYDGKGLFEEYVFSDVIINPVFTDDFSADNPAYNFK
jgi:hypothetical protein